MAASFPRPNNVLSDTNVAICALAGACATTRVRHGSCPPVPLPPARRTGVTLEASRPRAPSRGGAHHSIGCTAPRRCPCARSDKTPYVTFDVTAGSAAVSRVSFPIFDEGRQEKEPGFAVPSLPHTHALLTLVRAQG